MPGYDFICAGYKAGADREHNGMARQLELFPGEKSSEPLALLSFAKTISYDDHVNDNYADGRC